MDLNAVAGVSDSLSGLYDKIRPLFEDFRPEAKTMTVNFSRQTSQVGFQITVPEGFRKSTNKIKIPAFPGYRIIRMIDEGFQEQRDSWRRDGDYFILDAKNLPSSERYLIELEGRVSEKVLKDFVYIKPAVNRDSYSDADKYWLDTSIKKSRSSGTRL